MVALNNWMADKIDEAAENYITSMIRVYDEILDAYQKVALITKEEEAQLIDIITTRIMDAVARKLGIMVEK